MKKKIGIVTHYHNSVNYGGNLQAYALCSFLLNCGYDAEQICFPRYEKSLGISFLSKSGKEIFNVAIKRTKRLLLLPSQRNKLNNENVRTRSLKQNRGKNFFYFSQKLIPHSKTVYTRKNIVDAVDVYDAFITGSDQVWKFDGYNPIFFLTFVPSNKTKISYAASMAITAV